MTVVDSLGRRAGERRQQLPEVVAAYVRELIMSGAVRPGAFLRMEPIAEAVGVSNTPVREGLLTLRSEGFVNLVPRKGFVVASFTPEVVRDIFWAQAKLAGELAARATTRISKDALSDLEALARRFEDALTENDTDHIANIGESFHIAINKAADSRRLALLLDSIVSQLPRQFYAAIEGKIESTQAEHGAIMVALRKRQPAKARSLMEAHTLSSADHLISMLTSRGLWDGEQTA